MASGFLPFEGQEMVVFNEKLQSINLLWKTLEHFHANVISNGKPWIPALRWMLLIMRFHILNYSRSEIGLVFIPGFPFEVVAGGQNSQAHYDKKIFAAYHFIWQPLLATRKFLKVLSPFVPVHSMKRIWKPSCVGGDEDNTQAGINVSTLER